MAIEKKKNSQLQKSYSNCALLVILSLSVAVVALTRCRTILVERGRFRQAADREKNIAELYKNEANDPKKALESYEQAGDWYLQEGASA